MSHSVKRCGYLAAVIGVALAVWWRAPSPRKTADLLPEFSSSPATMAAMPPSERLATLLEALAKGDGSTGLEPTEMAVQNAVDHLSWADLPEALSWIRNIRVNDHSEAARELEFRLIHRWAEYDARTAASAVRELAAADRVEANARVARVWARQNYHEALEWAEHMVENEGRQTALAEVASEIIDAEPQAALGIAAKLESEEIRNDLVTRAATAWAARDIETARAWIAELPASSLREQMILGLALAWSEQDAPAAAGLVLQTMLPGEKQDSALLDVVQRWAARDIPAAQVWVDRMTNGQLQSKARKVLADVSARSEFARLAALAE